MKVAVATSWVDAEDAAELLECRRTEIPALAKAENWTRKSEAGEAVFLLDDVEATGRKLGRPRT
jgi:hypothetical protein